MNMKTKKTTDTVLLETTIQIHRIADSKEVKDGINAELLDKNVYTTTFVLREFIKTIISDLRFIYNLAPQAEQNDGRVSLSSLHRLLARGKGNYNPRAARREHYVIASIVEGLRDIAFSVEKLRTYLELTAEQWLREFFEIPLSNNEYMNFRNACLVETEDPPDHLFAWLTREPPIPSAPPFPSGAAKFLQQRRGEIKVIEVYLLESPTHQRDDRLLAMLSRLKTDNGEFDFVRRLTEKTRSNWALGDLLITLETPSIAKIYTTDRHYELLCPPAGRQRYHGYLPTGNRTRDSKG